MFQISNDYILLRKAFIDVKENEPIPVSMDMLSNIWFCTPRNAKIIVTKMVNHGWVEFVSGRGRGNRSLLTFKETLEEILFNQAIHFVKQGELKEALDQIQLFGEETNVKERIMSWLSDYFGYKVENEKDHRIEILRFPISRPITTLDPARIYYEFDAHITKQIYNTLIEYDRNYQEIRGGLAHHWESNKDLTKWVFYLRKGVQFHHGRELSVEDVMYSFTRLGDSPHRWLVQPIKEMLIHDKYTLQINLNSPNYLFSNYLAYTPMSILPADLCKTNEDFPLCPNGTGPFEVVKNNSDTCFLEAFTSHFAGRPQLDRIEIARVDNEANLWKLDKQNFERLFVNHDESFNDRHTKWQTKEEIYAGSSVLTLNLSKPGPQNSFYFRKAFHRLIDRAKMVSTLGEPRMYPSNGFQLKGLPSVIDREYNSSEVGPLLQKSGYSGEEVHLFSYKRHEPDALWLREECLKHGINLVVNIVDWEDMAEIQLIKNADCILFEVVLGEKEISQIHDYQFSNGFIRLHLGEEISGQVDMKINELLMEPNAASREDKLLDIENLLKENHAVLFLVHKKLGATFHPSVQGVHMNSRGWVDFKDIWFKSDKAKAALSE
ncbi:ABC transporter substrate-binding protein [Lederbergia citrea]|uniref:ABC transporter substrate-binding protein n=1 Tax=Lederbergia citrea TaxID=2833581 RepID=UPI001BC9C661|nr:ABC transporter substrate-binding protein [Lederbergia citrea]MBS4179573.1 SgrR family transcriptional regulator [Lederbergia citrea]